jgi:hypothetical protein
MKDLLIVIISWVVLFLVFFSISILSNEIPYNPNIINMLFVLGTIVGFVSIIFGTRAAFLIGDYEKKAYRPLYIIFGIISIVIGAILILLCTIYMFVGYLISGLYM